jgi:hypothetical protein
MKLNHQIEFSELNIDIKKGVEVFTALDIIFHLFMHALPSVGAIRKYFNILGG